MKASIQEAGADIKESGFIQLPATWKMEASHLKAHLNISVQAVVFIRRKRDKETKEIRGRGCERAGSVLGGLTWIFNISILELVSASQVPAVG